MTKTVFCHFNYKLKKNIKNHEINENKHYKMAIFNCFKNQKNVIK